MTISTQPTIFENVPIDIVTIGNEKWVLGAQIGHALGYVTGGHAIGKIYKRHASEFQDNDTMLVEIPTSAGPRLTRLYSAKGTAKIAMFANTEKAIVFRDWAANALTTPKLRSNTLELNKPADLKDELISTQRELINAQIMLLNRYNKEKRQTKPWTSDEDALIISMAKQQGTQRHWRPIADAIERTVGAVSSRGFFLRAKGLIS